MRPSWNVVCGIGVTLLLRAAEGSRRRQVQRLGLRILKIHLCISASGGVSASARPYREDGPIEAPWSWGCLCRGWCAGEFRICLLFLRPGLCADDACWADMQGSGCSPLDLLVGAPGQGGTGKEHLARCALPRPSGVAERSSISSRPGFRRSWCTPSPSRL